MPRLTTPTPFNTEWARRLRLIPGYDPIATAGTAVFVETLAQAERLCKSRPELATHKACLFVEELAQNVLEFSTECIQHVKGELAGQPFVPEPWEAAILLNIFGWIRPDGTRRYREVFLYIPRKNGKTFLAANIVCYVLFCDGEAGAECYSAAADRDQATLVFSHAKGMVLQEPELSRRAQIYETSKSIVLQGQGSSYKVISAEAACMTPETIILRGNGERCAAQDIQAGDIVMTWDTEYECPVQEKVRSVQWQPPSPVYEITTHRGRSITVTGDHPFYVQEYGRRPQDQTHRYAWKLAQDLQRGDRLRIGLGGDFDKSENAISPEEAYVMGAWTGDGCSTKYRFISADWPIVHTVQQFMESLGSWLKKGRQLYEWEVMGIGKRRISPGRAWIRQHFGQQKAREKTVPAVIFRSGASAWAAYLAGLLDTDGCVPVHKTSAYAFWASTSYALLVECQDLLARLGINAPIAQCKTMYRERLCLSWRLTVSGRQQLGLLYSLLATHLKHVGKKKRLSSHIDIVQNGFFAHTSDRVERIEKKAERQTVSLEVEQTHTHITNGLVTHNTKHGYNSHLVVIDELHAQPNAELVDVLITSTGARRQPLIVHVTTADFARPSICNEKYKYACDVRDNGGDPLKPGYDPSFLPIIYEAPLDADWADPVVWALCNPNLGVSLSLEYMERECQRAIESPRYQNTFRRLHLNTITEQDVRWIAMSDWDACLSAEVLYERLVGQACFAGLDLASTSDLCALVLYFYETHMVLPFFWLPEETALVRYRRSRVPYPTWVEQGYIRTTEGNVADTDAIRRDINQLGEDFNILDVAIDRWSALQLTNQLVGDGFVVTPFGQGYASMSAPSKELERLILSKALKHDGHPVLRWNMSNVMLETDSTENVKPSKKKSSEKIDGVISLVMGIGRAISQEIDTGSVYDQRGIITL